jgi:hypothetical protein
MLHRACCDAASAKDLLFSIVIYMFDSDTSITSTAARRCLQAVLLLCMHSSVASAAALPGTVAAAEQCSVLQANSSVASAAALSGTISATEQSSNHKPGSCLLS